MRPDHRSAVASQRRGKMRARLIEAALLVVAAKGLDAAMIDDVAATAGVSRGSFYNHFFTLQELLLAANRELADELVGFVLAEVADLQDPAEVVAHGTLMFLQLAQAQLQWPVLMSRLQLQLSREEGEFLFGQPSIADFALAHCLWFVKSTPITAPLVDDYPEVAVWLNRVLGFGHGAHSPLSADEALQIALAATPAALPATAPVPVQGIEWGQQVSIAATDYGVDPVSGQLLHADNESLILRREDPRAGILHVHFPRVGFRVEAK